MGSAAGTSVNAHYVPVGDTDYIDSVYKFGPNILN